MKKQISSFIMFIFWSTQTLHAAPAFFADLENNPELRKQMADRIVLTTHALISKEQAYLDTLLSAVVKDPDEVNKTQYAITSLSDVLNFGAGIDN